MSPEKDPFAQFLKHFDEGTPLFEEGDGGEELYIIRSGKVAIKKLSLIHISEPTRPVGISRMPSSA